MLPTFHVKSSLLLFYIFFNIHKNLTEKVSLAVSTIDLVGERGSTKAFTMKPSWRCVSFKRINIEHIFGIMHADFYTWNSSFSYYSPQKHFPHFHIFLFYTFITSYVFTIFHLIIWCIRREAHLKF